MIRDEIKAALVTAMKGGDKAATGTIRLIQSAITNRDIELRTSSATPDDDLVVTEVLQKMIKQRRESAELYRKGSYVTRSYSSDLARRSSVLLRKHGLDRKDTMLRLSDTRTAAIPPHLALTEPSLF